VAGGRFVFWRLLVVAGRSGTQKASNARTPTHTNYRAHAQTSIAAHHSGTASKTNNINSNPPGPRDLINQATAIIMDRLDLDAVQALELLRKMSQNTGTQICVVAEQVINHHVPVDATRGFEEAVRDFG
jgi:hypothetical protein